MRYQYKQFYRRKLPHIHPPGAVLFVTFRLAGSVPKAVLKEWKSEKQWLEHEINRVEVKAREARTMPALKHGARLAEFHRRWFLRFEEILHRAADGPTWLKDERIVKRVADSIEHRDGRVYRLDAYCIMSNHVHVVFKPFLDEKSLKRDSEAERLNYESSQPPLGVIMHSLKSYTANEANKVLNRSGAFWETESYDHVVKDEQEYDRVVAYVLNNLVKSGMVRHCRDWPWSWKRQ